MAVGRGAFGLRLDAQARQLARHHHDNALAAAGIAEGVFLAHFERVAARTQGHAHVFIHVELAVGDRALLADVAIVDFHAVDAEGELAAGRALDAHRGLAVRQHGAVFQADEGQFVVQRGQVEFRIVGRYHGLGRRGDDGGGLQFGAQALGAAGDGGAQLVAAGIQGEVGARQFAVLEVDEAAAGVARIAVRQDGQPAAGRQGGGVDLGHVGDRGHAGEAVAAVGIGLGEIAVLEPDAHVGHTRFVGVAQAVGIAVGEYGAQDMAFAAEDAGVDLDLGCGHAAGECGNGAAGLGAVDAIALQGAGADPHAVAQHAVRAGGQFADGDIEMRAAVGEFVLERRVIQAHRARHIAETGRQGVSHDHAAHGVVRGVEHAHRVVQHFADFDHGARRVLLQVQHALDRVERNVDGDHAEGGADGEFAAIGAVQIGFAAGWQPAWLDLRWEAVVGGRDDFQAVQAGGDQREVVHAAGVGDGGARHAGNAVDVEHDRRAARVAAVAGAGDVDQGHGGAGDRLVADAVVHDADRVDQDVGRDFTAAAADNAGSEGVVGHDFDHAVADVVFMTIGIVRAVHDYRGDTEGAAVDAGLGGHVILAVAGFSGGDGDVDFFGQVGVGIAVGGRDLDEQLAVGAGGARHGGEGGRGEIGDAVVAPRAHRVRFDAAGAAAGQGEAGAGLVDDGRSRGAAQQQGGDQAEEDELSELGDHGARESEGNSEAASRGAPRLHGY